MPHFNFQNSYHQLNDVFYADVLPEVPRNPELVLFNEKLAQELHIDFGDLDKNQLAKLLSGAEIPLGAEPLAMAYAGHQFGHFTMLGDGRAILLGEHLTQENKRVDIQLKGSGRTSFSRGGDGLSTLRAMLREYLISECMHALGVPTSRSLAVVKTGKPVNRETVHDGAVLTRIMDSHLRVGTFEYARQFLELNEQKELLNYAIQRHAPELRNNENPALSFFQHVANKQLELILNWMRVGFIHGVMNTDNMHIGGQTFDYGPCAFMNAYNPKTVFSSIDRHGRYAYSNQPEIALWNLSVFAGTILQQIDEDQEKAVELARAVLNDFAKNYREKWQTMMCAKIGFPSETHEAKLLIERLLSWMQENQADYTNTFLVLSGDLKEEHIPINDDFKHWLLDWKRTLENSCTWEEALKSMHANNPHAIPRNDKVESALDLAVHQNDLSMLLEMIEVVKDNQHPKREMYQVAQIEFDQGYQTFCGT